jgi:hypothetical protein
MVKLIGEWKNSPSSPRSQHDYAEPRCDHAYFLDAFKELNGLLAAELNGNSLVECMDTFMYGFWGEGAYLAFQQQPLPGLPHR